MEINKASAVVLYGTEGIKAATGRFFCYSDKLRLAHQTSAESTALYALGRTPNIEIDFVKTVIGSNTRRRRQFRRIGAAELKGDGIW